MSEAPESVRPPMDDLTPRQVVEELDRFIVGQHDRCGTIRHE